MSRSDKNFIQTYSGIAFYPADPRPEEVRLVDIAHALSRLPRYVGHTKDEGVGYSVAQHSVLVSLAVPEQDARHALLHDASEAYTGDCSRPMKTLPQMSPWREIEDRLTEVIFQAFGLSLPLPASVHEADNILLATEKRDLMGPSQTDWGAWLGEIQPLEMQLTPWMPPYAKQQFLSRFYELFQTRQLSKEVLAS